MRQALLMALRAIVEAGRLQKIVRPALALAGMRMSSFWIRHEFLSVRFNCRTPSEWQRESPAIHAETWGIVARRRLQLLLQLLQSGPANIARGRLTITMDDIPVLPAMRT